MVGFWVYKYQRNDDITLTEYSALGSDINALYPELSICISNPVMDSKLTSINSSLTKDMYQKYLKGETTLNETGTNVDYEQISLNLVDFLIILYQNQTGMYGSTKLYLCKFQKQFQWSWLWSIVEMLWN